MTRLDALGAAWHLVFLAAALPLVLLMPAEDEVPAALVLAALLGMSLLATAQHLLLLFVGLELMSLPAYLLVFWFRRDKRSLEAAIKYFFMGSAASALLLFGISAYYGLTGSMLALPAVGDTTRLQLAVILMGSAALFKIGAAPLHFWLPDVYEASVPELAGFFSTGVKAAGVLLLLKVLALVPPSPGGLASWLPIVAVVTMTAGNLLALRQDSLQRLLAYSSVAHVGYLLLGVWAWTRTGGAPASVFLYLAAYLFMSTGAFLAVRLAGLTRVRDASGLASTRPGLAAFLALMLLSLASVPPTSGFLAKFFVFWDAVAAGGVWLTAAAALNSVIGLGYYFGLIRSMYLDPPAAPVDTRPLTLRERALVAACAVPTLVLGLWPQAKVLAAAFLAD